jgi:hypothetical protein
MLMIINTKLLLISVFSILILSACSLNQISEVEKYIYEENVDGLQFKVGIEVDNTIMISGFIYNTEDKDVYYELGSRNCPTPTSISIISETGDELMQEVYTPDYPCRDEFVVKNLKKVRMFHDSGVLLKYNETVPFGGSFYSFKSKDKLPDGKYSVVVTLNIFPDEKLSIDFPVYVQN